MKKLNLLFILFSSGAISKCTFKFIEPLHFAQISLRHKKLSRQKIYKLLSYYPEHIFSQINLPIMNLMTIQEGVHYA